MLNKEHREHQNQRFRKEARSQNREGEKKRDKMIESIRNALTEIFNRNSNDLHSLVFDLDLNTKERI